jgi:hypothetical protein
MPKRTTDPGQWFETRKKVLQMKGTKKTMKKQDFWTKDNKFHLQTKFKVSITKLQTTIFFFHLLLDNYL